MPGPGPHPPFSSAGYPQFAPPPGARGPDGPRSAKGLLYGTLAVLVFLVLSYALSVTDWYMHDFGWGSSIIGLYRLVWILPLAAVALLVIMAADTRLRPRLGVALLSLASVGVLALWFILAAVASWTDGSLGFIYAYRLFYAFWFVAVSALLGAWFLGRRRSTGVLLLAPIGGAVAAVAPWLLDSLWWSASNAFVNALTNTLLFDLPVAAIAVGFAWLGVLLDRVIAKPETGHGPGLHPPSPAPFVAGPAGPAPQYGGQPAPFPQGRPGPPMAPPGFPPGPPSGSRHAAPPASRWP